MPPRKKKAPPRSRAAAKRAAQVRGHRTSADPLTRLQANQARLEQQAKAKLGRSRRLAGEWVSIASSRVHRAQYKPEERVINVVFADGTPWHYSGVSEDQFRRLREHEHPGSYINTLTAHADAHGYGNL